MWFSAPWLLALALGGPDCTGATAFEDFEVGVGSGFARAAACGAFVLSTNEKNEGFSWGHVVHQALLAEDFEIEMKVRRLTADGMYSMEVAIPGGSVLFSDHHVGFYETAAQWTAQGGWAAQLRRPALSEFQIRILQRGSDVEFFVDGKLVATHRWSERPKTGRVTIGLKGPSGRRSTLMFHSLVVRAAGLGSAGFGSAGVTATPAEAHKATSSARPK